MHLTHPDLVLLVYIVLMLAGGLMGYIKAGSKASLIASFAFSLLLGLCLLKVISVDWAADAILVFLMIFFGVRYARGRKFMPAGMMTLLSIAAVVLRHV